MDVLDRLHARLQLALKARGGRTDEPFTVAELYQQLIPYRTVRGELALLELAPYEHALLRLLAGERGFVALSDPDVVEDLRRELREPNPILGVYRDYAEVRVWLAAHAPPSAGGGGAMGGESDVTLDGATDLSGFVAPPLSPPPAAPRAGSSGVAATDAPSERAAGRAPTDGGSAFETGESPGSCISCREELPGVKGLRFCPACGVDQKERVCEGCGAAVRAAWEFCVHCGRRQRSGVRVRPAAGE